MAIVRSEGFYVNGIEPATFRFVAQHLNHCATAVPTLIFYTGTNHATEGTLQIPQRSAVCYVKYLPYKKKS